MPYSSERKLWHILSDIWTAIVLVFLIADFITRGSYEFLLPSFSIVYTGVLVFYVGTKEFDRWYDFHDGRHPGEVFVIVWTVVILVLFLAQLILGSGYKISPEMVPDYIMVLSIFAVTQKSKRLHGKRRVKK